MHLQFTEMLNPPAAGTDLEGAIGRLMILIAREESLVLQRSSLLSIADSLPAPAERRRELEEETATYLARLYNLAHAHGLDALRYIEGVDLRLVWIALAPGRREEVAS